jgi:hypothetical protein
MTPSATQQGSVQAPDKTVVRPFRVNVPEAELTELRRRINATRWPERETVADDSQGVQLATIQALARYWATDYDWRKIEAKMNALPQFMTEIRSADQSHCTRWKCIRCFPNGGPVNSRGATAPPGLNHVRNS